MMTIYVDYKQPYVNDNNNSGVTQGDNNNWLLVMTECPTNIVSRRQGQIGKAGSLIKP